MFYFSHLGKIFQGITLNSNLTIVSKVFVCLVGCFYCVFLLFFVCFGFPWKETNKKHSYILCWKHALHHANISKLFYVLLVLLEVKPLLLHNLLIHWSSLQHTAMPTSIFVFLSCIEVLLVKMSLWKKKKQKRMVILYYLYVENWRVLLSFPDSLEWQDKFYSQ